MGNNPDRGEEPAPAPEPETAVLKYAIASRCVVLALIVLWRTLLSPYDTSSSLNPPCLLPHGLPSPPPPERHRTGSAIQNSVVWDGVYFVRIAECGYEYEQAYAFLPFLPLSIRLLSRTVMAPLAPLLGHRTVLVLAGYFISNVAFVLAAVYFYRLSMAVLKDHNVALRASVIFCFNPASVFYFSIYSESLYSLFSIGGLYYVVSGGSNIAVLWFALSGCARSNGVLNAGYFCFQTMHQIYDAFVRRRSAFLAGKHVIIGVLRCTCTFAPFIAFQAYGYYNICSGHSRDERSPWCNGKVPLLYNYIQSHYWGVGFLRYFQLKQLPNFLLASPILSLALCSIVHYVSSEPIFFYSLGFQASKGEKIIVASSVCGDKVHRSENEPFGERFTHSNSLRQRKQLIKEGDPAGLPTEIYSSERPRYLSPFIVPLIFHLAFMVATAFFIMHVQVATRFLSASPPLYWFAAYMMVSPAYYRWGYVIWAYSAAYILLGSLLFSNFYPFT